MEGLMTGSGGGEGVVASTSHFLPGGDITLNVFSGTQSHTYDKIDFLRVGTIQHFFKVEAPLKITYTSRTIEHFLHTAR